MSWLHPFALVPEWSASWRSGCEPGQRGILLGEEWIPAVLGFHVLRREDPKFYEEKQNRINKSKDLKKKIPRWVCCPEREEGAVPSPSVTWSRSGEAVSCMLLHMIRIFMSFVEQSIQRCFRGKVVLSTVSDFRNELLIVWENQISFYFSKLSIKQRNLSFTQPPFWVTWFSNYK